LSNYLNKLYIICQMFLHLDRYFDLFYTKEFLIIDMFWRDFYIRIFSMVTSKSTWKVQKSTKSKVSPKKTTKKETISEVVVEKNVSNNSDTWVSVFTKTTNPKVVIQSDKIDTLDNCQKIHKHQILKSVCLIVMGIIILMTFFLSLKTYNTVNELYQLFNY